MIDMCVVNLVFGIVFEYCGWYWELEFVIVEGCELG